MKHKVAELEGALLDAAVAKAEGLEVVEHGAGLTRWDQDHGHWRGWNPSTDWRDGGPIIEREGISLHKIPPPDLYNEWGDQPPWPEKWQAKCRRPWEINGPKPLIAAMRAYVASKLGEEVELP